jgi:hypothetical protein
VNLGERDHVLALNRPVNVRGWLHVLALSGPTQPLAPLPEVAARAWNVIVKGFCIFCIRKSTFPKSAAPRRLLHSLAFVGVGS